MAVENHRQEFADKVALLCYKHFEKLPKKGKPQLDREWTILAAILVHNKNKDDLQIVSLATGSKCLGQNLLSPNGDLVNDSHAEVLARRGLLRYIHHQLGTENSISKNFHLYSSPVTLPVVMPPSFQNQLTVQQLMMKILVVKLLLTKSHALMRKTCTEPAPNALKVDRRIPNFPGWITTSPAYYAPNLEEEIQLYPCRAATSSPSGIF